ncbi:hypothetical protein RFI_11188 [Reticulomyxa filosa]|uniref:Uncharacterized protein n=1 Tax=Reticulomyxa filosa TaxID=46433 RepID=X6NJ74_RETFI|nr:hypothetical protein RFI_11188 [Reticulomyxa filosa]|eukprot:ETO25953.1 hypothetical protein RFI_11188 [Reticulomyxa filosa]
MRAGARENVTPVGVAPEAEDEANGPEISRNSVHEMKNGMDIERRHEEHVSNETTNASARAEATVVGNSSSRMFRMESESLSLGASVMLTQPLSPTNDQFAMGVAGPGVGVMSPHLQQAQFQQQPMPVNPQSNSAYYANVSPYGQGMSPISAYSIPNGQLFAYSNNNTPNGTIAATALNQDYVYFFFFFFFFENTYKKNYCSPSPPPLLSLQTKYDPIGHYDGKESSKGANRQDSDGKLNIHDGDNEHEEDELETDDDSAGGNDGRLSSERRQSSRLLRIRSAAKWDEEQMNEHEEEMRLQMAYLQQQTGSLHG